MSFVVSKNSLYILLFNFPCFRWTTWRLDVDGTFPENLKSRGVSDESVLPNYPYRDYGMLLYKAIKDYATGVLKIYYG